MIRIKHKGNFKNSELLLRKGVMDKYLHIFKKYGLLGVTVLSDNTPVDTGKTRESWQYRIVRKRNSIGLEWFNTNRVDGVPIAVILQYGHATGTGGWVEGIDYINPAIKPVFERMSKDIWREVTR